MLQKLLYTILYYYNYGNKANLLKNKKINEKIGLCFSPSPFQFTMSVCFVENSLLLKHSLFYVIYYCEAVVQNMLENNTLGEMRSYKS